jgi:hypothetical protein
MVIKEQHHSTAPYSSYITLTKIKVRRLNKVILTIIIILSRKDIEALTILIKNKKHYFYPNIKSIFINKIYCIWNLINLLFISV